MKIEAVTKKDAEELLEIYAPYVKETAITFEYEVPSVQEFENRIEGITEKYPYIKAVDENGKIAGYAYCSAFHPRAAYAWNVETTIYVRKDCKRNGIGKALYTELEARLKKMGITNMNSCIAVPKVEDEYLTNDSVKFHKKMGFTLVGTFHDSGYKFNRWYNMEWYEKMINPHTENQAPVKFKS